MAEITRYVLVDRHDVEEDFEYESYSDALNEAEQRQGIGEVCAIIERTYAYEDSELVWTPDGSGVWPPIHDGRCGDGYCPVCNP